MQEGLSDQNRRKWLSDGKLSDLALCPLSGVEGISLSDDGCVGIYRTLSGGFLSDDSDIPFGLYNFVNNNAIWAEISHFCSFLRFFRCFYHSWPITSRF